MHLEQKKTTFGSFLLGKDEVALPVASIQEVVNEPNKYTPMPMSPKYLLGLFNLRGMIIPVIDLKIIFGLDVTKCENKESRKIAIIKINGNLIGILFDKTHEIFTADPDEMHTFSDATNTIIQGVFKLDDGKRTIQILNLEAIAEIEALPHNINAHYEYSRSHARKKRKQCITFEVNNALCAYEIDKIQEIVEINAIEDSVLQSDLCLGAIPLRDLVIPVIDFKMILNGEESFDMKREDSFQKKKILVIKIDSAYLGLQVNAINDIVSYFEDDIVAFPALTLKKRDIFKGCISLNDGNEALLLDHNIILDDKEINHITQGHSDLYEGSNKEKLAATNASSERKTYITFKIDEHYAIDMCDIQEVIESPDEFIQSPGIKQCFKGAINLRGELIMIIDPGRLSGGTLSECNSECSKILVLRKESEKIGLLVNAVESIRTFSSSDKLKIPEIMLQNIKSNMVKTSEEFFQINEKEGKSDNILLFKTSNFFEFAGL